MLQWLFGKKREDPPAKPKPSAEQEAEDRWKYDFVVQFLSGPIWKTSLLDFIDYHCVVFDNEEENKFEYTTLHNKFKELVANLFDGMMQEVGLDDEKLAELLEKGFDSKHKKIFNQLLLADDFVKFKQLMVNRNKTLEAEAIKALEDYKGKGDQPKPHKKDKATSQAESVIRQSKRLEEEKRRLQLQEEEELRKVIELSKRQAEQHNAINQLSQIASKVEEKKAKEKEQQKIQAKPQVKVQQKVQPPKQQLPKSPVLERQPEQQPQQQIKRVSRVKKNLPSLESLPPVRQSKRLQQPPLLDSPEKKQPQVLIEKPAQQPSQAQKQQQQQQSQQQRKRRLLEQRQKIRRKKEEQRKKQMQQQSKHQVQTIVLQDDGIHQTQLRQEPQEKKVNNEELERRRELMKKIKNRIVDDF